MYRKSIFLILTFMFAALAACTPTAVQENDIDAENNEDALRRVTEVAEPAAADSDDNDQSEADMAEDELELEEEIVEETEDVAEPSEPIDVSLKKLPGLASSGDVSGGANATLPPATLGGAGGESISGQTEAASDVQDPISGSMVIDSFNMFEETEFIMMAELPATPAGQTAIERKRSLMTPELARQLATNFQFAGPIYQQQLPLDMMADIEVGVDGTFTDMPYFAFDNGRQLVMSTGSAWISYPQAQVLEYAIIGIDDFPEDQILAQTQAMLDTLSFVDFEYTLRAEPYGSVLVIPSYAGISPNQPLMGFYYTLDQAKNPVLQSMYMDLYSEIEIVGDYPILPAETAWQSLQPGLAEGTTNWYFSGPPIAVEPIIPGEPDVKPRFWRPSFDSANAVSIYGYPTVYNPIAQDGTPVILLDNTVIQGPADIGMMLATSEAGLFKFTGQYSATDGVNQLFLAESVLPLGYEEQFFAQGVAAVEGDQVFVDSEDFGRFQINNPPADVPNGMELFVNGYRNGETAEGTLLIDWQYLDEVVDYGEFVIAEPLPVDGIGFVENDFSSVTITSVELSYGISWPQSQVDEESGEYRPINSDFLIPIWKFSGTMADGAELTFEIPAVDDGYFSEN